MVLIKARIAKIKITSKNAVVVIITDIIAMEDTSVTPTISKATIRSGRLGPIIIRITLIQIDIP